ncbi:D-alanyl-D-alanine carboxypeptidase family protein [Lacibacterium aquatile]|uniref:serine-type D-Ala-D-Ala carboxypeptidase n=1 Tax=Lacibacterium aquatile TaxID=1168082 RepID=A0ABW5DPZ5_9PROT
MAKSLVTAFFVAAVATSIAVPYYAEAQQKPPAKPATQPQKPAAKPAMPPPPPAPTVDARGFPLIETGAEFAYIIDATTGAVLLDKNGSQRMYPSSMTKIMTAYLVFEKLKKGELKLEDELTVSEKAWRMGGSKMFIEVGTRVKILDLLHGAVISSGNDACVALAEGLAGSEEAFAEQMTRKARELGMMDTNFRNASGWPDPDHWTTSHDLAVLAYATIRDFPDLYQMYADRQFTFNGIKQDNRNPLLASLAGSDGLKTGHTEIAGYGLTASAVREGRRLIMVINGLKSMRDRAQESERLMSWAFREFDNYALFKPGDVVEEVPVWLGQAKTVPVSVQQQSVVTLPRRLRKDMQVSVKYESPVKAPVQQGQEIGQLVVTTPNLPPIQLPLVAAQSVGELGLFGRVGAAVNHFVLGQ